MNLPSWAGHVNAAVIRINKLPVDYSPAQFGYLVGSTGSARTLAALMDDGDADEAELTRRLTGDGLNYDCHLDNLRNEGLIQCEGNILRAHPGLTTKVAMLTVYQYTRRPQMGAPFLAFAAQAWTIHRPSTKGPDHPIAGKRNHLIPADAAGTAEIAEDGTLRVITQAAGASQAVQHGQLPERPGQSIPGHIRRLRLRPVYIQPTG